MTGAAAAEQEKQTIADKLATAYRENEQTAYRQVGATELSTLFRKDGLCLLYLESNGVLAGRRASGSGGYSGEKTTWQENQHETTQLSSSA